jgi:hypothetical protein
MSERVVALLQRAQNDQHFQAEMLRATPNELLALGLKPGQQAVLLSNLLLTNPSQSGDLNWLHGTSVRKATIRTIEFLSIACRENQNQVQFT